jgi:polysaccharide biosynthesis/export protein
MLVSAPSRFLGRALICNALATVVCVAGCASAEPRFAARQIPAELLVQTWQAPCSLDLPQSALHRGSNVVEPGDEVVLAVTTAQDTANVTRVTSIVDDDGTVVVPQLGRMMIAGTAPRTVEKAIVQTCYDRGVPTRPFVEVTLKRVRQHQITVLGGVTRPGVCTLSRDRSDLVSALAAAGGLAKNAGDKILIQRPPSSAVGSPGQIELSGVTLKAGGVAASPQNTGSVAMRQEIDLRALAAGKTIAPQLQDGDLVTVELCDLPTVQVTGLVQHPGSFEFPIGRDYRVLDAIASANGVSNKVVDTVVICRKTSDGAKRALIQVSLHDASRDQAENIVLFPGDVVSVEPTRKTLVKDGLKYARFAVIPVTMMVARGGL